jgi:hypothetical protein
MSVVLNAAYGWTVLSTAQCASICLALSLVTSRHVSESGGDADVKVGRVVGHVITPILVWAAVWFIAK